MPRQQNLLIWQAIMRREDRGFHEMREEFHSHDTHPARLPYCAMKPYTETGLSNESEKQFPLLIKPCRQT